jgi:hypothetical protein
MAAARPGRACKNVGKGIVVFLRCLERVATLWEAPGKSDETIGRVQRLYNKSFERQTLGEFCRDTVRRIEQSQA